MMNVYLTWQTCQHDKRPRRWCYLHQNGIEFEGEAVFFGVQQFITHASNLHAPGRMCVCG